MIPVIGLSGFAGCGKDTAFQCINRLTNGKAYRLSFGDEVKIEVAKACDTTPDHIDFKKALFRPVLQWWGTDWKRERCGSDYWVKKMDYELNYAHRNYSALYSVIVVTDVRFFNEANLIQSDHDGYLIRIHRRWPIRRLIRYLSHNSPDRHDSEREMTRWGMLGNSWDAVIDNNGTIEDLENQLRPIVGQITQ